MSGRNVLDEVRYIGGVDKEIMKGGRGRLLSLLTQLLDSLWSFNCNSTPIFINLPLTSQGDRIQTLTRISPDDWLDTATPRGHSTKKDCSFFPPPAFPLSFVTAFSVCSCCYPQHHKYCLLLYRFLQPLLSPSYDKSCFFPSEFLLSFRCWSDTAPSFSVWWAAPQGSDRVISLKMDWHQKEMMDCGHISSI